MKMNVVLYSFGMMDISANWAFEANAVKNYNRLYFVKSGSGVYIQGDTKTLLLPNHMYLLPGGNNILFQNGDDLHLEHLFFDFGVPAYRICDKALDFDLDEYPTFKLYFQYLADYFTENNLESVNCIANREIFEKYKEMINYQLGIILLSAEVDKMIVYEPNDLIDRAMDYIYNRDDTIDKALSVKSIAKHLAINEYSFIREFKKKMKQSPYQYLKKMRLGFAVKLLNEGIPIKEISDKIGYESISSFYKAFKKEYGVTPVDYKKKADERLEY